MRNIRKNRKKRIEQDKEQPTNSVKLEHVSRDITMHDKIEQPTYDAQTRYRALFENANDAIFIVEADKFVECNPKTCELFGCTPDQIIGKTPYDPYSPEFQPDGCKSKDKALEKIRLAMQGKSQFFEWRHLRYDGSAFDVEVSLNRLEISDKILIQAVVRDITKRKKLEDKLKNSEEKYQTLVEHVNELIYMHDSDGKLTYVSPQCEKITGYSTQELVGQQWTSYATDNPINKLALDIFEEARETGKPPETHQVEIRKKDGDVIVLEVNDSIVRNAKGDITGVVGSARDITERKQVREELERLTAILENTSDLVSTATPDQQLTYFNSAGRKLVGWGDDESLEGKKISDVHPKWAIDLVETEGIPGAIRDGIWEGETAILNPDGKDFPVSQVVMSHKSPNGEVEYLSTIIRDITERKEVEKALRISEEKFNKAFYSSPNAVTISTLKEGRIIAANEAVTRVLGYAHDEIIGKTSAELKIWSLAEDRNKMVEMLKKGDKIQDQELQFRHKSGEIRHLVLSAEIIELEGEDCIVTATKDITERKRLEEAYRSLVDNSLQGLAIVQDGRVVFLNKAFYSTTDYSKEDFLNATPEQFQSIVHPDDRELVWSRHRDRLAGKPVPPRYDCRWIRKDGSTCWLELYASRIEYHGRPAIQVAYIDITERKRAEEALFNEKKFTEDAINTQMDTFFLFEPETGKAIRWNKAFKDISGYTDGEIARMPAPASYYCPEDLERAEVFIQKVLKEGLGTIELELICKDGRKVPTEYRVSLINDDQGEPKYIISIGRDITERKRAEEALQRERRLNEGLFKTTPAFAVAIDAEGKTVMMNDAMCNALGYTYDEIDGTDYLTTFVPERDRERLAGVFESLIMTTESAVIENSILSKDGQELLVEWHGSQLFNLRGDFEFLFGVGVDMTERKKAEEALRVERDKLQALMDGIDRAGIGIDIIGANYEVMFQNKILEEDCGELLGKCCYEHYMELEEPCDQCPAMGAIKEKKTVSVEHRGLDGRDYQVFSAPLPDADGTVSKAIEIVIEITERKKSQEKLLDYQKQLKSLASELLLAEERERRRIATGVHDDIGQKLALAKLELQSIQAIVTEPAVSESLGHACELIDKGIQDARSLAFDLSNPVLYEVGFVAAVESLLTEQMIRKSGIKSEFESKIRKIKLGQDMSIVLFQAVRELLTNVVKHAKAHKVKVCIDKSDNRVHVIVEDDGAGFELSKLQSPDRKKGGFGLFNVKERLEYLGGSFDIESKPGQGTRVMITVPLESSVTAS